MGSKKRNIAIQLILQQSYKTSCTFFCRPMYRTFSYLCSALIRRRAKRLTKSVRYNKVSLYRGSLPYILLLLGKKYRLLYGRPSLHRGSLHRGLTVVFLLILFAAIPCAGKMSNEKMRLKEFPATFPYQLVDVKCV